MKNWNFFVKLAVIFFIVFGVITIVRLRLQISGLEDNVESASAQIAELSDDIDALLEEIEEPVDEDYIKRVARDNLNYHLPNEIVFYNDS